MTTARAQRYFKRKKHYKDFTGQEWVCSCGHYQEDGLHCDACTNEPPWGCVCSFCQSSGWADEETYEFDEPPLSIDTQSHFEAFEDGTLSDRFTVEELGVYRRRFEPGPEQTDDLPF